MFGREKDSKDKGKGALWDPVRDSGGNGSHPIHMTGEPGEKWAMGQTVQTGPVRGMHLSGEGHIQPC